MPKEYDPEVEAMLRGDEPSRAGHLGPQFQSREYEPVKFEDEDFTETAVRLNVEDGHIAIGGNKYPAIKHPRFSDWYVDTDLDHLIPTESGWHARITAPYQDKGARILVEPEYFGDKEYGGNTRASYFLADRTAPSPTPPHWAVSDKEGSLRGQDAGVSSFGWVYNLSEQGIEKAIEAIGRLPKPKKHGNPRHPHDPRFSD